TAWAPTIARMPDLRRRATLVAFAHAFEIRALDDALDLLDLVVTEVVAEAHRLGRNERLRTLRDLDTAALQLRQACEMLLDDTYDSAQLRAHVFARLSREQLQAAVATVAALARPPDDNYYPERVERYHQVRRFLPTLLRALVFEGTQAGQPVLEAVDFLARIEGQRKPDMDWAPLDLVSGAWRRWIHTTEGEVDRRAYTLCALERLQDSLRRRDVFVSSSERWGDPRAQLLQGDEWNSLRAQVCRTLGRQPTGRDELKELAGQLDEAFRRTATNLPTNTAVSIDHTQGWATLTLSGLDKEEEPPRLLDLRQQVEARLPRIDLPGLLLEIHARTGFADEFTHLSEGGTRVKDLPVSLCAVLMAEACNLGLEPVMRPDLPTLAPGRLYWVQQNYLRAETLTRANARLVNAQSRSQLAQTWGGGEVASADGLRFVVPVRTLNAGPNRKYFHVGRGVTYYNFTSDQFTGFHGIVIPGTLRDSLYILEGLLEQETGLNPVEIMSDTAGASDIIFGLFWLLGYQFSPRLADVGEARFWRMDKDADYESLEALARQRINARLIERNWDDLLRLAGSLKLGRIRASELVRSLLSSNRPSTLARALRELGRISKTLFLLAYIDDENYRRRILIQLNRGEGRHLLARTTFHGQRGELRKRYREGQEDQLGALGLVVNVIVLWNTLYMEAALNQLRSEGTRIEEEDVARLSPLGYRHISFLGEYSFAIPDAVAQGQLRPLRNPEKEEIP
ncbi:MAG: Tn3 family transposase, partial [Planctomycetes bacterium]|nr:Tn3 family transposase [Planctomycetota bacterium]